GGLERARAFPVVLPFLFDALGVVTGHIVVFRVCGVRKCIEGRPVCNCCDSGEKRHLAAGDGAPKPYSRFQAPRLGIKRKSSCVGQGSIAITADFRPTNRFGTMIENRADPQVRTIDRRAGSWPPGLDTAMMGIGVTELIILALIGLMT